LIGSLSSLLKIEISKVLPEVNQTEISQLQLMQILDNQKSQKFSSEKEYVDEHKRAMEKYKKFFVDELNFPNYASVDLVDFNDPNLAGGYYTDSTFYLNCNAWKDSNKYEVESLVLHEAIPGHHTQIHIDEHNAILHTNNENMLRYYFYPLLNGFVEGWGLWSEKLGVDQNSWITIGQLQYEMLRTIRIIVDIDIHCYNKNAEYVIQFMKSYLAMPESSLSSEAYRYIVWPGQAVSYKVGAFVFQSIFGETDLLSKDKIEKYKDILNNQSKPLYELIKMLPNKLEFL
jgi:uncharacterized protein (DUF885 family)